MSGRRESNAALLRFVAQAGKGTQLPQQAGGIAAAPRKEGGTRGRLRRLTAARVHAPPPASPPTGTGRALTTPSPSPSPQAVSDGHLEAPPRPAAGKRSAAPKVASPSSRDVSQRVVHPAAPPPAGVSQEAYDTAQAQLTSTQSQLTEAQRQLSETKAALASSHVAEADLRSQVDSLKADLASSRSASGAGAAEAKAAPGVAPALAFWC